MRFAGVGSWIEGRARRSPEGSALISGGMVLTYVELAGRIRAAASEFLRLGVAPGDRVAYHGLNDPAALTSFFASAALGAIWVPIHPARPEDEVRAVLADSDPRLLVRSEPKTHPGSGVPEVEAEQLAGLPIPSEPPSEREPNPDDLVMLAYTSGTTGAPKGVMLSHANVLWGVVQMVAACTFAPTDVTLAAAPFTRMGGLGVTVLPTLFVGGSVVVPDNPDGPGVLETIERARISVVFANPDLLEAMVRAPGWSDADLSSVRTGVVGGGLVPEPLLRAYLDRGVSLLHGYGLTEAAPVVSLLDERDAAVRPRSVGRALPFVEVRGARPDGSPCGAGEVGAWWIRGPNVTAGYWQRPPIHDEDGWFPTGDVGSIDEEGYLTFVDRASSAMHVGGSVIYPASIERALYGLPGLKEAAAVDVDDRIMIAVVAEGKGAPDLAAVSATARGVVGASDTPIEVRSALSIPRNAAGKILRAQLRESLRTDR
jgi:acyl-CoA synthetase (AMP-forming)/AMP-acid ligase II